jgi:hypothetical protein
VKRLSKDFLKTVQRLSKDSPKTMKWLKFGSDLGPRNESDDSIEWKEVFYKNLFVRFMESKMESLLIQV